MFLYCAAVIAQCPTPTPPPNESVIALSPYSAAFQVNPATAPTVGYVAERKPDGGTWEIINNGYPSGRFLDNYECLPSSKYFYRTRARTACAQPTPTLSVYTPEVSVTLPAGPPPNQNAPDPPTELSVIYINGAVSLVWTAGAFPVVAGQFQVFGVERSTDGITYAYVNFTQQTSLMDHPLAGHTYWYRVRAWNGFGWRTGMYFECAPNRTDCGTAFTNIVTITL